MSIRSIPRMGSFASRLAAVSLAMAALAPAAPARAAEGAASDPAAASESAVWKPTETSFVYMGFTTKYSCEGLVDKVRSILLTLGANRDLTVYGTGCAVSAGRPAPMPGVRVRMKVLQPASSVVSSGGAAQPSVVPAHWKWVEVKLNGDPLSDAGECELVEQLKQKVLPLFATRDTDFKSTCVPHQLNPNGTRLRAQVLLADEADKRAAASAEAAR